ncbi:MAG: GNAT family N-acetyltransferase [Oscillospiraceae bacterium]|jgi:RimJ/RimL family protein N-acetyltransferase|nr:GNAT family N-acetyltransferase [Oscillospiraceae bacterium]
MKYFKKIPGERVYLSPYNLEDVRILTKWLNDSAVTDGLGDTFMQFNLLNETQWVEDMLKKTEPAFAIVLNETDELIGSIALMDVKLACGSATVGLFIGEAENRSKGLGTEAMKLIIGYAFNVLNLYNVNLAVYDFNEGAYKSYLKVGFREIGRRRKAYYLNNKRHDIIYMDITREDWYGRA